MLRGENTPSSLVVKDRGSGRGGLELDGEEVRGRLVQPVHPKATGSRGSSLHLGNGVG